MIIHRKLLQFCNFFAKSSVREGGKIEYEQQSKLLFAYFLFKAKHFCFQSKKDEHILLKILHKDFCCLHILGSGWKGDTTFILVILAVFVLICTLTFLSYLFFQNTNVGIIVYVVVVVYTKIGTNPSKFRPRT